MERIDHWTYFDHLAGDRMSREPRLSLLSLTRGDPQMIDLIRHKFSVEELGNYQKLLLNNRLKTSSVGRLFDAVASLLDLSDVNTYEGEAAMYLEAKATEAYMEDPEFNLYYNTETDVLLNTYELIRAIAKDVRQGLIKPENIALKFHVSMVKYIEILARRHEFEHLTFSGGVLQNGLLVDLIHRDLGGKFKLYFHTELSPNDENISYGQLIKHYISGKLKENVNHLNHKIFK